jgi:hypothetical protein
MCWLRGELGSFPLREIEDPEELPYPALDALTCEFLEMPPGEERDKLAAKFFAAIERLLEVGSEEVADLILQCFVEPMVLGSSQHQATAAKYSALRGARTQAMADRRAEAQRLFREGQQRRGLRLP